jgi:hypothetical protein
MKLEKMRLESELARVIAAKKEQEYIVEQRLDEIERLKKSIDIQSTKEQDLNQKLIELKGKYE